jgi:hypothetical protein
MNNGMIDTLAVVLFPESDAVFQSFFSMETGSPETNGVLGASCFGPCLLLLSFPPHRQTVSRNQIHDILNPHSRFDHDRHYQYT